MSRWTISLKSSEGYNCNEVIMVDDKLKNRIYKLLKIYRVEEAINDYENIYICGYKWTRNIMHDYLCKCGYKDKLRGFLRIDDELNSYLDNDVNIVDLKGNETVFVYIITYKLDYDTIKNELERIGIGNIQLVNCFDKRDAHFYYNLPETRFIDEFKYVFGLNNASDVRKWLVQSNAYKEQYKDIGKRKYIFFTADISCIGGLQLYVAGKKHYLESEGWTVYIVHCGTELYSSVIPEFNYYVGCSLPELGMPVENFSVNEIEETIELVKTLIDWNSGDNLCVIESHFECVAVWAELFSESVKGKHYCFNCNEIFRGPDKYYERYLDFFKFKYERRELATTSIQATQMLFEGRDDIDFKECICFDPVEKMPIMDVDDFDVSCIPSADYRICYIGRTQKGYFDNIINGVYEFADHCRTIRKSVAFVVVGYLNEDKKEEILNYKKTNLQYCFLDDLVPIPNKLYECIDLVVGGSDSAYYSALMGVPVVIADAANYNANGIYGYDTKDLLYCESEKIQMSFFKAFVRALISKKYLELPCDIPTRDIHREHCKQMDLIKKSDQKKEYYDFKINSLG